MLRVAPEWNLTVFAILLALALWYAWTWLFPYPLTVLPSALDINLLPLTAPALEMYSLERDDMISLFLDLLNLIRHKLEYALIQRTSLCQIKSPEISHTQTLIYEHQTLSVLCDFLYWNHAMPALKQKRGSDKNLFLWIQGSQGTSKVICFKCRVDHLDSTHQNNNYKMTTRQTLSFNRIPGLVLKD